MIDATNSMLYYLNNLNRENERITHQMGSGKILNKGSDDSILHGEVINLEDKLRVTESLTLQLTKTKSMNDTADSSLGEVKASLDSIRDDLMKALNAGIDRSNKLAIATNLEGIRENIFDAINTKIDGEYIFSGSNSTYETLQKDEDFKVNGRIDYGGDGFLRKVAVQPGSYRERGITAYDASFYTSSKALKSQGDDFTFQDRERIIDEDGYEWKVIDPATNLERDPNDPVVPLVLQKYDHNGEMMDVSKYPDSRIAIDTVTAQVEADAVITQDSVRETYTILGTNTDMLAQVDSRVFEAKHSYFDDLNKTINALEGYVTKLDGTKGGEIADNQDAFIDDIVANGLESTTKQFDSTNIGHGELGGRNAVFEGALEKLATQETHYNILILETNGADKSKLAMESSALELTYQALYSTIAKMNQLSLLNYVK
jgi:flagellar hook-associated protein 3 FlgL